MLISVGKIDYYVELRGEGEAIILLHGFTGDCSTWNQLVNVLVDSFQVISIDLTGHGMTDSPADISRYEMKSVAHDVITILDKIGIEQTHVLGYSMGGRLALSMAVLYPERIKSLVLESASPGLKTLEERDKRIQQDELLAKRINEKGIKEFVDYWEQIPLFLSQKNLPELSHKAIRIQRLANNPLGLANSLKGMGTGKQPSWWKSLHRLEIPVLLLCGEQDEKFCQIALEMQDLIPNAKLVTFKGVGHAIHVEDPVKFGTMIVEFLSNQVLYIKKGGFLHGNSMDESKRI